MRIESVRAELKASVQRTLREESRRNELRVAYVRSLLIGLQTAIAWTLDWIIEPHALPNAWIEDLFFLALFLASVVLLVLLRRGHYWKYSHIVIPLGDALMLVSAFFITLWAHGAEVFTRYEVRTTLALATAILAVTGAARLHRRAIYVSTGLAAAAYLAVSAQVGWKQIDMLAVAMLTAFGYLGLWLTRLVQRVAEGEVARGMLRRFLPASVVDQAHGNPLAIIGEPEVVQMTVLVMDIRNFTAFVETNPAAEAFDVLGEVLGVMAEIVLKHGGAVQQFTGDGLLAIFGIGAQTPHAKRALDAVEEMRRARDTLRESSVPPERFDLQLGMAVHSGSVLTGCLGTGGRLEFTMVGDAVNATFRLQALTKEYKVDLLVTADTVRLLDSPSYKLRKLGVAAVRGKTQNMPLFTIDR